MEMELLPPSRLLLLVLFEPAGQAKHLFSTRQELLALPPLFRPCSKGSRTFLRARQELQAGCCCKFHLQSSILEGGAKQS